MFGHNANLKHVLIEKVGVGNASWGKKKSDMAGEKRSEEERNVRKQFHFQLQ